MTKAETLDEKISKLEKRISKSETAGNSAKNGISPDLLFRLGTLYLEKYRTVTGTKKQSYYPENFDTKNFGTERQGTALASITGFLLNDAGNNPEENSEERCKKTQECAICNGCVEYIAKAFDKFEETIARKSTHLGAHFHIAMLSHTLGNETLALNEIRAVLRYKPTHSDAHFSLGKIYENQGRFEAAQKHFELFDSYSFSKDIFDCLAVQSADSQNELPYVLEQKLGELKKEIKIRPFDSSLHFHIGVLHEILASRKTKTRAKKKNESKAQKYYQTAERINPFIFLPELLNISKLYKYLEIAERENIEINNECLMQLSSLYAKLEDYSQKKQAKWKKSEHKEDNENTASSAPLNIEILARLGRPFKDAAEYLLAQYLPHALSVEDAGKINDSTINKPPEYLRKRIYENIVQLMLSNAADHLRNSDKKLHLYPHCIDTQVWLAVLLQASRIDIKDLSYKDRIALLDAAGKHDIERKFEERVNKRDFGIGVSWNDWVVGYDNFYNLIKKDLPQSLSGLSVIEWHELYKSYSPNGKCIFKALYDKYKEAHSIRSAKIARQINQKEDWPDELMDLTEHLILRHETGGDKLSDLVRDADSISHFYIVDYDEEPYLKEFKIDYMYNRMSPRAQIIAGPFYTLASLKLLTLIEEKCPNHRKDEIMAKIRMNQQRIYNNIPNFNFLEGLNPLLNEYVWKAYMDTFRKIEELIPSTLEKHIIGSLVFENNPERDCMHTDTDTATSTAIHPAHSPVHSFYPHSTALTVRSLASKKTAGGLKLSYRTEMSEIERMPIARIPKTISQSTHQNF